VEDIRGVTLEEAKVLNRFLTEISFAAPGTIDAQYQTLSRLISFRSKVRQAIARARQMATEQDQEHKEE
jgi:hypothetical protein